MLPSASIFQVPAGIAIAAFAGFGAGYAFHESTVIHGGDRPIHLISAGRGAFFGVLIGVLAVELVAAAITIF